MDHDIGDSLRRIHDRLGRIEVSLGKMEVLPDTIDEHERALRGHNGDVGIVARVKSIEDRETVRSTWMRVLGSTVIGLVLKSAWDFVASLGVQHR